MSNSTSRLPWQRVPPKGCLWHNQLNYRTNISIKVIQVPDVKFNLQPAVAVRFPEGMPLA